MDDFRLSKLNRVNFEKYHQQHRYRAFHRAISSFKWNEESVLKVHHSMY